MKQHITLFDTAMGSDNLGDEIIMDAVTQELNALYPDACFDAISTHIPLHPVARNIARRNELGFVGGTNILCANWLLHNQWNIGLLDFWRMGHPILMGVGWSYYQRNTDQLTAFMLKQLLHKHKLHSARDSYTTQRLKDAGIPNVINTACPTMWKLTPEHCAQIPTTRAKNALITVTAYRNAPEVDRKWIEKITSHYETIYCWPQMKEDRHYVEAITDRCVFLDETLAAYDQILKTCELDYVGTRLHGGIRALQHKRRTLIIEVDNRATEIARDTGLPTMKRDDTAALERWIHDEVPCTIRLPLDAIALWKRQFADIIELAPAKEITKQPVRVTVVIPVYNAAGTLEKAVQSVLNQTEKNLEIIIVDDGSTDGSTDIAEKLLKQDSRIKLCKLPINRGKSHALNLAVKHTIGQWIAILDADDWFAPQRIKTLLDAAEMNDVDFVADNHIAIDCKAGNIPVSKAFPERGFNYIIGLDEFLQSSDPTASYDYGMLQPIIRKSFILEHKLQYFEPARIGEDFYFHLCFFMAGGKALIIDTPYYYYLQPFGAVSHQWAQPNRKPYNYEQLQYVHTHFVQQLGNRLSDSNQKLLLTRGKKIDAMIYFHRMREYYAKSNLSDAISTAFQAPQEFWLVVAKRALKRISAAFS